MLNNQQKGLATNRDGGGCQRSGFGGRGGSSVWDALNVRSLRMRMGLRIPKSEVSMAGPGFVGWKLT